MIDTVGSFIGGLGGLASALAAYLSLRREGKDLTRDKADEITRGSETGRADIDIDETLLLKMSVIRPKLLDAARRRIENAEERFVRTINDPRMTPEQRDQEAKIAQAEICALLQLIKDHNSGVIPSNELQAIWQSFDCSATAPLISS